jgi:HPt (histidine-containing phosphotransfer) domain-containing protein/CheY-like chemotaxis protein
MNTEFTPETSSEKGEQPAGRPPILVVEDHPLNRKLFPMILANLGFPVLVAEGEDILEKASTAALVFVGIKPFRFPAAEIPLTLRQHGYQHPVILLNSSPTPKPDGSFDDTLSAPFTLRSVVDILGKWYKGASVPKPAQEGMVLNTVAMYESFMGNRELIKSIVTRFINRTVNQIEEFSGLLEKVDWETARREAHTIKGSSRMVGGEELGNIAEILEHACRDADLDTATAALPPLAEAFSRFREAAEEYLPQLE